MWVHVCNVCMYSRYVVCMYVCMTVCVCTLECMYYVPVCMYRYVFMCVGCVQSTNHVLREIVIFKNNCTVYRVRK